MKRKSNLDHSSRVTYASAPASASASGASPPSSGDYARADASTLVGRRMVRASGDEDVRSKKHRRKAWLHGISELNKGFAKWAEDVRPQVPEFKVGDDPKTKPPVFFLEACQEYQREAAALRERYCLTYGEVMTFGNGDMGQLGIADRDGDAVSEVLRPRAVKALRNQKVVDLSLGGLHSVAVLENGELYTWGGNDEGQLGQYLFENLEGVSAPVSCPDFVEQIDTAVVPAKVTGFVPSKSSATYPSDYVAGTDEAILMASSGDCHTICLSTSGNVYLFGCYKDGEGKSWRDPAPSDELRGDKERVIEDAFVAKYVQDHDTPASKEGAIKEEAEFKRNQRAPKGMQKWPIHVFRMPRKVKFIDSGASFNAGILDDDSIVTWGTGAMGELGRPVREMRNKKSGVYDLDAVENEHMMPMSPLFGGLSVKMPVVTVACGGWHLLAVAKGEDSSGLAVYSTGLNNYGQLGHGDKENRSVLTRISDLDGLNISRLAAGYHHSLVLDGTGKDLYAFGRADYGQCGNTDKLPDSGHCEPNPVSVYLEYDRDAPIQAEQPQVQSITCGANHNLVVTEGSVLYTWGYGDTAALGHGIDVDQFRPKKVDLRSKKEIAGAVPSKPPAIVRRAAGGGQFSAILVTTPE